MNRRKFSVFCDSGILSYVLLEADANVWFRWTEAVASCQLFIAGKEQINCSLQYDSLGCKLNVYHMVLLKLGYYYLFPGLQTVLPSLLETKKEKKKNKQQTRENPTPPQKPHKGPPTNIARYTMEKVEYPIPITPQYKLALFKQKLIA